MLTNKSQYDVKFFEPLNSKNITAVIKGNKDINDKILPEKCYCHITASNKILTLNIKYRYFKAFLFAHAFSIILNQLYHL